MTDTLAGQTVGGRYKLIKQLGRGGMAEVYLARQESLDRDVAVKLMHPFLEAEEDFLHRFKREAKAMAALNHPNIVSVYDFDVYGQNSYYLVMEYINGGTLKEKLEELGRTGQHLPLERAIEITLEVLSALAYAHARGMVHRDIKPANIMLDENEKAIITDFGIVKMVGGQASMAHTATGALIGTPSYMSPEQALGKPGDERVDIYSVGVMLFQMVAGQLPFTADTPLAVVMKHVTEPAPMPVSFNPDIPAGLQDIILKSLAKDPADRFQTAKEMSKALRATNLTDAPPPISQFITPATTIPAPVVPAAQQTAPGHTVAGATVTKPSAGDVLGTQNETAASAPPARSFPWLYLALGIVALIVILILFVLPGLGGGDEEPAATLPVAADVPTDTVAPINTAESAPTAETTAVPDQLGTLIADLTKAAIPTVTLTPSKTPPASPTATPTADATAEFLANCTINVELISAYTYQNPQFHSAPIGANFPMNWRLKNSGTCPWPATLHWYYAEGEDFNYDDPPIELGQEVASGEEIVLSTTFTAPTTARVYESTWQLVDANGEPFGLPITFDITAYVPATPTPKATNTPAVAATPTLAVVELNFAFSILPGSCTYLGSDWQCTLELTPYGGGGGPYTIFVFDQPAGQATEFRGPWPAYYFPLARRCFAFNQEFRVLDDATGTTFSRHIYIDPNEAFEGGCVTP